jgi:hypothetical protein
LWKQPNVSSHRHKRADDSGTTVHMCESIKNKTCWAGFKTAEEEGLKLCMGIDILTSSFVLEKGSERWMALCQKCNLVTLLNGQGWLKISS